jgi:DoxX-like protein
MTKLANSTDCSRRRIIAYRVTTVIIAAEFAVGGVMDVLQLPPFFTILKHLGYPGYFSVILGVRKVLGAVAVRAPRFPRLKEWAYAGMFFNMTGAAASHRPVGDPLSRWWLRSSSPASWSPPGPCVRWLAETTPPAPPPPPLAPPVTTRAELFRFAPEPARTILSDKPNLYHEA